MAFALGVQALLGAQGAGTLGCGELPAASSQAWYARLAPPAPGPRHRGSAGPDHGRRFQLAGRGPVRPRQRGPPPRPAHRPDRVPSVLSQRSRRLRRPAGQRGPGRLPHQRGHGQLPQPAPGGPGRSPHERGRPLLRRPPAAMRGLGRFQRREHLLLGLGSTRFRSHRTRLGAAPGRFSLRQLRGHHFRVQSRDLPARHRDQRPCLPDQRLERAERVSGLPRRHRSRHRPQTAQRYGNDASTHHRRTPGSGHARTPEPGSRSQAACSDARQAPRPGPCRRRAAARTPRPRPSHLS